ncbi:unnamed protein product [Arctogadus glacialis]
MVERQCRVPPPAGVESPAFGPTGTLSKGAESRLPLGWSIQLFNLSRNFIKLLDRALSKADRSLLEIMEVKKEKDDEYCGKPEEKATERHDHNISWSFLILLNA